MTIELTDLEYRRLLDLVYVGNWILNSARGRDRIGDYDYMESKIFSYAPKCGMKSLVQTPFGVPKPSKAFQEGGIHEAICDYEDAVFFEILAEELARRDLNLFGEPEDPAPLNNRIEEYMQEFEANGLENLSVDF
ncbi:MAG: hypothetical protein UEE32_06895 [Oscillospiraceae bacterium]|nr:hypothetical protein [Oscillospiraceae bacterium]